jgi:hypothetical protein
MRKVLIWLGAALVAATVLGAAELAVQLRTAKLRSKPDFLGPIVATLNYGDKIQQLGEQDGWLHVRTAQGAEGWLHPSAVNKAKSVEAGGKKADTSASADEVALAGKGFNEDVEKKYAADHKDLDFAQVDQMEKTKASETELRAFASEGGLLAGGGA